MEPDEYDYDRNNEAAKPLPDTYEIIKKTPRLSRMCDASKRQCHNAMIKFAEAKNQEIAVAFLNWVQTDFHDYEHLPDHMWTDWSKDEQGNFIKITTAELFLKYKQSRNEK